jgi:transposase
MANVLLAFEPLKGRREMRVTEHRRKLEFADMMRYLLDDLYPEVERIRLVVDNLNTHSPAAFYESFTAQEARRMSKRIEFVYTPKHGSWLNMVEIELSVLVRQCLKRRLADTQALEREAGAWCQERTAWAQASTGASPLKMPASSYANSIHQLTLDGGLVLLR